jgi:hypothetical protein
MQDAVFYTETTAGFPYDFDSIIYGGLVHPLMRFPVIKADGVNFLPFFGFLIAEIIFPEESKRNMASHGFPLFGFGFGFGLHSFPLNLNGSRQGTLAKAGRMNR